MRSATPTTTHQQMPGAAITVVLAAWSRGERAETGRALPLVSLGTAKREWTAARLRLDRELTS